MVNVSNELIVSEVTALDSYFCLDWALKHWLGTVGCVVISVRIDRFSRIELFPSNVLSSEKTNCKNDIQ